MAINRVFMKSLPMAKESFDTQPHVELLNFVLSKQDMY